MCPSSDPSPTKADYNTLKKKCAKQAKEIEQLQLKEAMLESLLSFAPDHLYFKDSKSRFIALGQTMKHWFGAKNISDIIGKSDADLFSTEHASKALEDEQYILTSGTAMLSQKEKETWEDGRITWVSTSKAPIRNKSGEIIGTFGISRDITQQKLADERLKEATKAIWDERNLLQTVIDLVPDAIYVKDKQHKFVLSNRTHYTMMGLTDESEIQGKTESGFYDEDIVKAIEAEENSVIQNNLSLINIEEQRIDPKTRDTIWLSTSKVALNNYKLSGVVCVTRDISAIRQALTKLEDAKNDAEIANQAKSEFLAKMSHEIRTPLNSILGLTQHILDTELDSKHLNDLNTVRESAELLLHIIDDLLDYSKIEAGSIALAEAPFNLRTTIEDVMDIVFFQQEETEVEVISIIEENVPEKLLGDTGRLRQILLNLLSNAKKFTHSGYILLRASVASNDKAKICIKFSIEDSGIGIAKDQLERIFLSFSQADDSITRKYGGTGLGLAISQKLAYLMGGKIKAISPTKNTDQLSHASGSTFYFTADFNLTTESAETTQFSNPKSDKHLLIVGCSSLTEISLSSILQATYINFVFVKNCTQAIETLKEQSIDVIICEMSLLNSASSFELTTHLKEQSIPAIILCRYGEPTTPTFPYRFQIVNKPLRKTYLLTALDSICKPINISNSESNHHQKVDSPFEQLKRMKKNKNILLVEDNPVNQQVAVAILERVGMIVDIAENGQLAIEAMNQKPYHLVLMDLQMPVMDGLTATREIRKQIEFRDTPIIALTAQAMKGDLESCLEAGMNDYVSKPIRAQHFYKILHQWLDRRL